MTRAYLGFGSNVGNRIENLRAAVDRINSVDGVAVLAQSSVYETEPVGEMLEQRDFYNAAVEIETELEPQELLAACKAVEQELGRVSGGPRHGPRPIDVDLLLVGNTTLNEEGLALPHPQVTSRRFVLEPLVELDSELTLPNGTRLLDALGALGFEQRVRRAAPL